MPCLNDITTLGDKINQDTQNLHKMVKKYLDSYIAIGDFSNIAAVYDQIGQYLPDTIYVNSSLDQLLTKIFGRSWAETFYFEKYVEYSVDYVISHIHSICKESEYYPTECQALLEYADTDDNEKAVNYIIQEIKAIAVKERFNNFTYDW